MQLECEKTARYITNEARILFVGGALLQAPFSEVDLLLKKRYFFEKNMCFGYKEASYSKSSPPTN